MTRVLSIDPGTTQSAWLVLQDGVTVLDFGIDPNDRLLGLLRALPAWPGSPGYIDSVAIETIEPRYGAQVGWETLDTARLLGRMEEAAHPLPVTLLVRSRWLRALGIVTARKKGEPKGNADAGVRAMLIDRWGGPGVERRGGPLAGISRDVWQALGLAVCVYDHPGEADR